jgi:hypothetical protein
VRKLIKQFEITLDLINDVSNEVFSINQNDLNNIQFDFNLLNDGIPIDLTGSTIRFAIKKPDHFTVIQDAEIVEIGKARVLLTTQSYNEIGNHIGEIYLYENDQTHVFKSKFKYFVAESILNDETIESANEWQTINEVLVKIDGLGEIGETISVEDVLASTLMIDALSSKASVDHIHDIQDVTNLQTDLDEKSDINHNHDTEYHKKNEALKVEAADQVIAASFKNVNGEIVMLIHPSVNAFQSWDELNGAKPFSIEGFEGALLPSITLNSTIVNTPGNLQEGGINLSDIYSPSTHIHDVQDVTNLETILNEKAPIDSPVFVGNAALKGTGAVMKFVSTGLANTLYFGFYGLDVDGVSEVQRGYFGIASSSTPNTMTLASSKGDIELKPRAGYFIQATGLIKENGTLLSDKYASIENTQKIIFKMFSNVLQNISANALTKITFQVFSPNVGNGLNASLHQFIAPKTGNYQLFFRVQALDFPTGARGIIESYVNGTSTGMIMDETVSVTGNKMFDASSLVSLNAGDYVEMYFQSSVDISTNSNYLYGYLL